MGGMVMNKKIKDHIVNYCKKNGWGYDSDDELWETITESGKEVYRGNRDQHRWYNEYFVVVDLNGMEIGFYDAETTGDNSASDIGWEFDLDRCCEVEKTEETKVIITYKPIEKPPQ
jgi:hypothetical protein